jgi:acyl-CoA thioesterase II
MTDPSPEREADPWQADPMAGLLAILDLEELDDNLFRGRSPRSAWQRVFGGQAIAQALVAAGRTVPPERFVHSLHAYFLRPGDVGRPILYEVARPRDGGSFSTRHVHAVQHGQAILAMTASFQRDEDGFGHQAVMPAGLPAAETLPSQGEILARMGGQVPEAIRRYWSRPRPFEMRPVALDHYLGRAKLEPRQNVWVRAASAVPADRLTQAAALAYLSDMTLLDTATFAHGSGVFDPAIQAASLDHAMWFHRRDPLDGWLLYHQDSPSASNARGFTRGAIFSARGALIASTAQEGLIRPRGRQG